MKMYEDAYENMRKEHMKVLERLEWLEDMADDYIQLPKAFWDELVITRERESMLSKIMENAEVEEV